MSMTSANVPSGAKLVTNSIVATPNNKAAAVRNDR